MITLENYLKYEPDIPVILHLGGKKIACKAGDAGKFVKENALKNTFVGSTHVDTSADDWVLEIWPEDEHEIG